MTRQIIKNTLLVIGIIFLLNNFVKGYLSIKHNLHNNLSEFIFILTLVFLGTVILWFTVAIIISFFDGNFDSFFAKYTDPKIKQFNDFLNRKNNVQ